MKEDKFEDKPLYAIDLDADNSEKEVKAFFKHAFGLDRDHYTEHKNEQTANLLFYLGRGPSAKSSDAEFQGNLGRAPSTRFDRFRPMTVNHLKDITDNQVAQLTASKISYFISPKESKDVSIQNKVKVSKKVLLTIQDERNFGQTIKDFVSESRVFGESYILVYWDENLGTINEDAAKSKEETLLDDKGNPLRDEAGNIVKINPLMRNGDVNYRLLDPREVIIQPAKSFDDAEWVIVEEVEFVESLRLNYPKKASKISDATSFETFNAHAGKYNTVQGKKKVYTLYHRPIPEMPKGRLIKYVDDVILENRPLPHATLYKENLFPIIPLTDVSIHGSPRGIAGTIYGPGKPLQIAINNLYTIALRNIAKFPPFRAWPRGSLDPDQMRGGAPMDVRFDQNKGTPKFLSAEPVSQSVTLLIDSLTKRLMQITNVLPISRGETIPNTESRLMLDFFAQKEREQNGPALRKINRALVDIARVTLAIAADMYDEEMRFTKVFGRDSRFEFQRISKSDLEIPVDIYIKPVSPQPETPEGKMTQITQLLQAFPGIVTPQEALDLLEMGDPEKLYDRETASIDLAKAEIESILNGEEVLSPQAWMDLIPYYSIYLDTIQMIQVRPLLPEVYSPDDESIGGRLLNQIMTCESILWDKRKDNEALNQELTSRFPLFPSVFVPEPLEVIDPFAIQENAIPEELIPPEEPQI